ncbi:hypothetical protein J6590_071626 [Homalodisca vitripennis]|nr:hypothetical protein J6590_071626 [Homalodisca vitripennis]
MSDFAARQVTKEGKRRKKAQNCAFWPSHKSKEQLYTCYAIYFLCRYPKQSAYDEIVHPGLHTSGMDSCTHAKQDTSYAAALSCSEVMRWYCKSSEGDSNLHMTRLCTLASTLVEWTAVRMLNKIRPMQLL